MSDTMSTFDALFQIDIRTHSKTKGAPASSPGWGGRDAPATDTAVLSRVNIDGDGMQSLQDLWGGLCPKGQGREGLRSSPAPCLPLVVSGSL